MANSGNLPEGQFAHEKKLFLTPRQRQLAEEVRSEASSINTTFMSGFSWLFHQLSTVRSSTAKGSKVSETLPYLVGSSQEFAYVCMLNHHGLPHSF